jgi:hypothetical protein
MKGGLGKTSDCTDKRWVWCVMLQYFVRKSIMA